MDLKDFVKSVLIDIDSAVDEARQTANRDIRFSEKQNIRTIEFDIAVSAENTNGATGKAGIKVLAVAEAGGDISQISKNSKVSRIIFGLNIDSSTKKERQEDESEYRSHNNALTRSNFSV
jgi:hypothetical protein